MFFLIEFHGFEGIMASASASKVVVRLGFVTLLCYAQPVHRMIEIVSEPAVAEAAMNGIAAFHSDLVRFGHDGMEQDIKHALDAAVEYRRKLI